MNEQFERFISLIGEKNFLKLSNSKIAIIGVGGVGGVAAITLARSGVGTIIIQDYDVVNISNINRQVVANLNTIGKNKVDVLEEMIKDINPKCKIEKIKEKFANNFSDVIMQNKPDFIIDAIDDLDAKFSLIKNCIKYNIDFISSGGAAKKLDLTALRVLEISKTTHDPIAKILRKKLREEAICDKIYIVSSNEDRSLYDSLSSSNFDIDNNILASYMPVTATAGLLLADYAIKKIILK